MRRTYPGNVSLVLLLAILTACRNDSNTSGSSCDYRPIRLPALSGTTVVLGDSYASGEGTYNNGSDCSVPSVDYYADTAIGKDKCHRSPAAYPLLGVQPGNFKACSGATIWDVEHGSDGEPPQLDILRSTQASRVIVSVGGDDVGFSHVLDACISEPTHNKTADDCTEALTETKVAIEHLTPALLSLYRQIESLSHDAQLVVVGYPRIFPEGGHSGCNWLGTDKQVQLNYAADDLDQTIQDAVAQIPGAQFVDVRDSYVGHEICGAVSGPYTNDLQQNTKIGPANCPVAYVVMAACSQSFHPNVNGYAAVAQLLFDRLKSPTPSPRATTQPPTSTAGCPGFAYFDEQPADQCSTFGGTLNQNGWTITVEGLAPSPADTGLAQLCSQVTAINRDSKVGLMTGLYWSIETQQTAGAAPTIAATIGGTLNESGYIAPGGTATGTICFADPGSTQGILVVYSTPGGGRLVWIG